MIFFKTGYARVPKVLTITGPHKGWDQNSQGFKTRNKDLIQKNSVLSDLKLEYIKVIEEWEVQDINWTPVQLAHHFDKPKEEQKKIVIRTVSECFDVIINAMRNRKRIKNGVERTSASIAEIYHYLRNSLRIFTETVYHKDFSKYYFKDIDEKFLNDYVVHLKKRGVDGG